MGLISRSLLIYQSGTITSNGNSGVIDIEDALGFPSPTKQMCVSTAWLNLVPANLASDETLDLDLNVSWLEDGTGDIKVHDFTQVTSTNASEQLILPGDDSEGVMYSVLGSNAGVVPAPIPPYWKLTWTLGGTAKSMDFSLYGCILAVM